MNLTQKLRQLHADITTSGDGFKIVDAWTMAERLLGRLPVDQARVKQVIASKDAEGFAAILDELEGLTKPASKPAAADLPTFTDGDLDAALKAFKKRLKLMRLSDESRLGGRYTSGGRTSKIDAIEPPREFDPKIWKALAAIGSLNDTGGGFYALPADPKPR